MPKNESWTSDDINVADSRRRSGGEKKSIQRNRSALLLSSSFGKHHLDWLTVCDGIAANLIRSKRSDDNDSMIKIDRQIARPSNDVGHISSVRSMSYANGFRFGRRLCKLPRWTYTFWPLAVHRQSPWLVWQIMWNKFFGPFPIKMYSDEWVNIDRFNWNVIDFRCAFERITNRMESPLDELIETTTTQFSGGQPQWWWSRKANKPFSAATVTNVMNEIQYFVLDRSHTVPCVFRERPTLEVVVIFFLSHFRCPKSFDDRICIHHRCGRCREFYLIFVFFQKIFCV